MNARKVAKQERLKTMRALPVAHRRTGELDSASVQAQVARSLIDDRDPEIVARRRRVLVVEFAAFHHDHRRTW